MSLADSVARPGLATLGGGAGAILRRLGVLAGLVGLWQIATLVANDPVYWPTPVTIGERLWSEWIANPAAWVDSMAPSLWRLLTGWAGAVVVGVALGTVIGRSTRARDYVDPILGFARAIPPPALLPLFIVLLGIGDGMKVSLIGFGVVWPILLNTADGVASVEPLLRDTGRAFRISGRATLLRIVLPSAAPRIFAGLRISLSIAVILMVISELYATIDGIGFELVQAQRSFRTLDVWAIIVLLGIIGYALNTILATSERRLLAWHRGATRTDP